MVSCGYRGLTLLEVLVLIIVVALVAALIVIKIASARESARRISCASNLNQIGKACFMYSEVQSYGGLFPSGSKTNDPFDDKKPINNFENLLFPIYVADYRLFSCPSKPVKPLMANEIRPQADYKTFSDWCGYAYDPGHGSKDLLAAIAADKKGAGENSDNHGSNAGQNVLLVTGAVEFMKTPMRKLDPSKTGKPMPDDNIYQLDPMLPRNIDSYIRQ